MRGLFGGRELFEENDFPKELAKIIQSRKEKRKEEELITETQASLYIAAYRKCG